MAKLAPIYVGLRQDAIVEVRDCVKQGPLMPKSAVVCASPRAGRSCAGGRHVKTLCKPVSAVRMLAWKQDKSVQGVVHQGRP